MQKPTRPPCTNQDELESELADLVRVARNLSRAELLYLTTIVEGFRRANALFQDDVRACPRAFRWSENEHLGAPELCGALLSANFYASGEGFDPYGHDPITTHAKRVLSRTFECKGDVYFVGSGTAANGCAIAAFAGRGERVLTGLGSHILTLEAGAVSHLTGGAHVEAITESERKVVPADILRALRPVRSTLHEHTLAAKVVFISNPSERGLVYSAQELRELKECCTSHGLVLGIDAARMPYIPRTQGESLAALVASADFFTLSISKTSGLLGAAIVFREYLPENVEFDRLLKGAGHKIDAAAYVASQFSYLYSTRRFFNQFEAAVEQARWLERELVARGFAVEVVESNGVFVSLPAALVDAIRDRHSFYEWRSRSLLDNPVADETTIRIMIRAESDEPAIQALLEDIDCYCCEQRSTLKSAVANSDPQDVFEARSSVTTSEE